MQMCMQSRTFLCAHAEEKKEDFNFKNIKTEKYTHIPSPRKLSLLYYLWHWKCQDTIMCSCIVVFARLTFGISFIFLRCQRVQCYGNVHYDKLAPQLDRQDPEQ